MTDFTSVILSAKVALLGTSMLITVCAPLTYLLVYADFRGKILVETLIGLPLVLPPTVLGFYLLLGLGPQGVIGSFWQQLTGTALVFTFTGVVLAASLHSIPFAVQPLKAAFEKVDRRLIESSYVLGVSPAATFFRVVLPNTMNGILAAAVLTFAHIMGEFGVILMVGGSIPGETKVASIEIFDKVESLQYSEAGKLSLTLLLVSFAVLLLVNFLHRGRNHGA